LDISKLNYLRLLAEDSLVKDKFKMKKIAVYLSLCMVPFYTFGQNFYMYLDGQKIYYEVSASKMFLKTKTLGAIDIENELQSDGSIISIEPIGIDGLFLIEMQPTNKEKILELVRQWNAKEDVIFASPILLDENRQEECGYTNEVLVKLKSKEDYPVLQKIAEDYQIKEITINEFDEFIYTLLLPHNSRKDAMEIGNELHETGLFEYANPNRIFIGRLGTTNNMLPYKESGVFSLYPNPVSNILYVNLDQIVSSQNNTFISYNIVLYNTQGNILRQTKAKDKITQLNVSNLASGIYFLHIFDNISATSEIRKIFVKH